jgi:hypothetical protein
MPWHKVQVGTKSGEGVAVCVSWLVFEDSPQDLGHRKFPRQFCLNQSSEVSERAVEGHNIPPFQGPGLKNLPDMGHPVNLLQSVSSSIKWV